ncbi:uncharacterized protein TRIADDRAFT_31473 [Trichoplax adhaerens]|uniref:ornithine decarboxylase n=1 Tax=Trichoplax adhaerens TaxID=10228 RepID=B3S9G7_TRIAD|nr:hypothetical protein TRIADDRAFT_31473 [Trichoplax adhaerens]EDV20646.1 hypothetical protein TRIADDRAFT_31473 [Trichoplax adhaerens]|eukprot:XP_002116846.1 hypothetical protein TRIADDRAFT_31473 [Trichoplax adhaerens]
MPYVKFKNEDDPFYLVDISDLICKYKTWMSLLPRIRPFYAMKCNPNFQMVATLCRLGAGLDVASAGEIETAVALGLKGEDVIYSNTCKGISHLKVAANEGITQMTFDSEEELHRIKRILPNARLLLRLLVDDSGAQWKHGIKAGAPFSRVSHLFKVAKKLGLNLVGTSFHVGSDCGDPSAYSKAIERCRKAFDIAVSLGMELSMLDIGGGYPGHADTLFKNVGATSINEAIDIHFPSGCGVKIISEPGKYFAMSSSILCANIIGKRLRYEDGDVQIEGVKALEVMYHISEGMGGSFLSVIATHQQYIPKKLSNNNEKCYRSSLWGPSCTATDCLLSDFNLPEMETGEWVYYDDLGAYTSSTATNFNGFKKAKSSYFISEDYWYDIFLQKL